MSILVLNAGSSTLKFALFDNNAETDLCHGVVDWQGRKNEAQLKLKHGSLVDDFIAQTQLPTYGDAVGWICRVLYENGFREPIRAVGHRVVHDG